MFSYRWAGLDPKNGDPRIFVSDTVSNFNNYSKAATSDLVFHGPKNPRIFGSFINTFTWKNIAISANIIYKFGHYFRRNSVDYTGLLNTGFSGHIDYNSRWLTPGDESITNVPSLPMVSNPFRDFSYLYSDVLVEKADHIRLQDLKFNYSLNKNVVKRLPFKQVSIYIYVANLGIIWRANKLGLDPDAYMFGNIPTPKSLAFGLNANF